MKPCAKIWSENEASSQHNMFSKAKKDKQKKTGVFEDFRDVNVSKSFRELLRVRRGALFSFTFSFRSHGVSFCKFFPLSRKSSKPRSGKLRSKPLAQPPSRRASRSLSRTDPMAPLSRNFRASFAGFFFPFRGKILKSKQENRRQFCN